MKPYQTVIVFVIIFFTAILLINVIGKRITSDIVSIAIFILMVAGFIFGIRSIYKSIAQPLKSFAKQHGYSFSYDDTIGLREKCRSTLGRAVVQNIVSFKDKNESYFVFHRDTKYYCNVVCLIEMESNLNCSISVSPSTEYYSPSVFLPKTKFLTPKIFKKIEAMVLAREDLKELKLNNPEFDKNFTVYTDDLAIASGLLTDKVVWYTIDYLRRFKTSSVIWSLDKNMLAVRLEKRHLSSGSVQEIENLVNYSKELKGYLIKE